MSPRPHDPLDYDFEGLYKNIQLATLLKHAGKQLHSGDGQYEISTPHSLHTSRCVGIPRFSFLFLLLKRRHVCLPGWRFHCRCVSGLISPRLFRARILTTYVRLFLRPQSIRRWQDTVGDR